MLERTTYLKIFGPFFFFLQFKDSVLNIMSGVKIDRINLVTKVAVITAYSTKRVDQSLPQSSQVRYDLFLRYNCSFSLINVIYYKFTKQYSKNLPVYKNL